MRSNEECRLVDANDQVVDTVTLPLRHKGQGPRSVVYCGKRYEEDESGFYGPGVLVEKARPN